MIFTVYLNHTMSIVMHFLSSTLSCLEISLTSSTDAHGLQRHHGQQSPLLSGLQRPAQFLSCLGKHVIFSPCGHLILCLCCQLLSTPCLWCEWKPLLAQGLGFKISGRLELSACTTAEVQHLKNVSVPSAWGRDRRS